MSKAVWQAMKQRCYNSRNRDYKNYGARGITVCERWRNSYEAFKADMGPCPYKYTLERINNNGPYSPDNCIWASRSVQNRNRRQPAKRTDTLKAAAERVGLKYHTYLRRLGLGAM